MITSFYKNRLEFSAVKVRFQKYGEILLFIAVICNFDYSLAAVRIPCRNYLSATMKFAFIADYVKIWYVSKHIYVTALIY